MPANANSALDQLCVNTIRFLAVDAVERARSGHPGAPMGAAPFAYVLWGRFLRHNPRNPAWFDRDRFILSAGHASMLLYALLHLTGYAVTLDDIRNFRQWESPTPGHPERIAPGIEVTTGPLGQGFGDAVGLAIAEAHLAQRYNRPGHEIINHRTYVIASDGDMMEGVSSEAASIAGTLRLGKLVVLYDDNDVSIEGSTDLTFKEDVAARFRAYGWGVTGPIDGMDINTVDHALREVTADMARPKLIICRTVIGYGSPNKAGDAVSHGEPLGAEEVELTRRNLGWTFPPFTVPQEALQHFRLAIERGQNWQQAWQARFETYRKVYPQEAQQLEAELRGDLPAGWDSDLDGLFKDQVKPVSTREASGRVINAVAGKAPALMGGAADLAPSTRTLIKDAGDFSAENRLGRNMHFGVREHCMGAIASGMAVHGGVIPYTATFLIFYDYMRPPVRLAAMMGVRVIYLFTHDSVGLGQDGPTHQPIEQLAGLRAVPRLVTLRPADATETVEAWKIALERTHGPTAICLTRQNVPVLDRSKLAPAAGVRQGGYTLWEPGGTPDAIIIGTGSEAHVALEAGQRLLKGGIKARVVSLPSWGLFDAQPSQYRESVLPPEMRRRVSVEAASPMGWERYVGLEGTVIGLNRFGVSAPGEIVLQKLGVTPESVTDAVQKLMENS